jgi:hypothetical protein
LEGLEKKIEEAKSRERGAYKITRKSSIKGSISPHSWHKKIISAEIRCPDHVYADAADFRCWRFWRIFSAAIAGVIESLALDAFSLTRYMISLD